MTKIPFRWCVLECLVLTSGLALAQEAPQSTPSSSALPDVIYKGVGGKILDQVPMDASDRLTLQRANAVVSNTMTARSIAVWAGFSNPVFLVGGLLWGIVSATNIKPDTSALIAGQSVPHLFGPVDPPRRSLFQVHCHFKMVEWKSCDFEAVSFRDSRATTSWGLSDASNEALSVP